MKTIIAGTRAAMREHVWQAMIACPWVDEISETVSGKDKHVFPDGTITGADYWGEQWAHEQPHNTAEFPADWDTYGRAAGPIRNSEMADYADACIVVWDGHSRGSADMIAKARAKGLRLFVWDYVEGVEVTTNG